MNFLEFELLTSCVDVLLHYLNLFRASILDWLLTTFCHCLPKGTLARMGGMSSFVQCFYSTILFYWFHNFH